MKKRLSLRLQITLTCAVLLALCCILLALTSNLSALQMADTIQAATVVPARTTDGDSAAAPMIALGESEPSRQARQTFQVQSLLAAAAVLAAGVLLIYLLVGRALAPLDSLTCQIRERTADKLDQPLSVPGGGNEVAELTRAFNQMSWQLNQVFEMQKNFSHNAAHEFRTPLAVLKTRVGLFRKKQDFQPESTLEFLQIVEGEVDRLSHMVGDLLSLTNLERVERGVRISAGELIQSAVDEVSLQAAERQTSIRVDVTSDTLIGSEDLLRRAVFNLVENAVKYSPANSDVHVTGYRKDGRFRIEVADQGPGIPAKLRSRIFEPFFRVDEARSRQQGGTGLGLALVRSIAESHGGAVYAEENPGGGSRFVLELPAEATEEN